MASSRTLLLSSADPDPVFIILDPDPVFKILYPDLVFKILDPDPDSA